MSKAEKDVLAERQRQIDVKGWTPEHDDEHSEGELADAADCYASALPYLSPMPNIWPWCPVWWKPESKRRNLVKASALYLAESERYERKAQFIIAEIERLDRQ